nr:OmpH family outer membrane protein [uncultured Treponema sp.]
MKKYTVILICLLAGAAAASAQQITRFAVVDTSRIYATFLRDSRSVRDYQAKQAKYQAETQRMSDEIIALRQKKVDAEAIGRSDAVQKYQAEIDAKTSFLLEYSKACNDELAMLRKALVSDDVFYARLYAAIKKIAETQGYTMVLNLQQGEAIIWYSPTVDITETVIRELSSN